MIKKAIWFGRVIILNDLDFNWLDQSLLSKLAFSSWRKWNWQQIKLSHIFPIPRLEQQQLRAVPGQILRPAEAAWPTLKRGRQRLVIVCVIVSPKIEIFHVHQEMQAFSDICLEFFTLFPLHWIKKQKGEKKWMFAFNFGNTCIYRCPWKGWPWKCHTQTFSGGLDDDSSWGPQIFSPTYIRELRLWFWLW